MKHNATDVSTNNPITEFSTGLPALDKLIGGVLPGDNFVWHVDSYDTFFPVARMFTKGAYALDHNVVFFRWNDTKNPFRQWDTDLTRNVFEYRLHPKNDFERFITEMHTVIEDAAPHTVFIFDLLSDLTNHFRAEQSLENFFVLTCPFILQMKHLGVFPILRNRHPFSTAHPIQETTQIDIDLFHYNQAKHLHLRKADGRHTDLMYTMHRWEEDRLVPLLNSVDAVTALHDGGWEGLQSASYRMIIQWDREFMNGAEYLAQPQIDAAEKQKQLTRLLPMIITRDPRMLRLYERYFTLEDIIYVWKRTIGSGMIGGKSAGMLLSRAIVKKEIPEASQYLEPHDSFFIASDVYYDFLVKNNCWRIRKKQQCRETLLEDAAVGRKRILNGNFSAEIMQRFADMLRYFGQEPIIVRSSSLQEDAYQNAFAGKYESVFCSNQGTPQTRLDAFTNAVRTVYASTMSNEALRYREKRNLLGQDEQMAILVQRVSGTRCRNTFYPHMAGVGLSYNPYIWNPKIKPEAGVLRLVVGLGTRAVDRHDDDHARVVALNMPELPPLGDSESGRSYTQCKVDIINLKENKIQSRYFVDLIEQCKNFPSNRLAAVDTIVQKRQQETGHRGRVPWVVDFTQLFRNTDLASSFQKILVALKKTYETEVEIEFTVTLLPDDSVRLNIVQCRPFQIELDGELATSSQIPAHAVLKTKQTTILHANGAILGKSRRHHVNRIIFVVPAAYSMLSEQDKYIVARLIGKLTRLTPPKVNDDDEHVNVVLVGPGRWGTRMPSLGVPITSSDISNVSAMCELDIMHEGLIPDLSLGTHFFHELVESNILYIGYFSARPDNSLHMQFLTQTHNRLEELLPEENRWENVVRVIDSTATIPLYLSADLQQQSAKLFGIEQT
ncbi:MAG: pyruvate, phosphate dikinase [Deltaproteobacteria bacterium]|nr:pyruvate, phosphate dikinase [Deltaproteobacteria bacterium]MBN2670287.1 pyruvate, phosphate dikinase [Deltaproteobacteria bacterium]